MTTENIEIIIPDVPQEVITETKEEPVDLLQTNGQIQLRPYIYKLKQNNDWKYIVAIAPNSSSARQGIIWQFNGCTIHFVGVCDGVVQVQ